MGFPLCMDKCIICGAYGNGCIAGNGDDDFYLAPLDVLKKRLPITKDLREYEKIVSAINEYVEKTNTPVVTAEQKQEPPLNIPKFQALLQHIQKNNGWENAYHVNHELHRVAYKYLDAKMDTRDGSIYEITLRESAPSGYDRTFQIETQDDLDRLYGYLMRSV